MSASATVFTAQIKGTDGATGPFQRIAQSMRGMIAATKGLTVASKGLTKASAEGASAQHRFIATLGTHMRLLHGHLGSVNAGIIGVRNSISGLLPMIGALGAGASLAGLFELTKSVSEASVQMEATAIKTGNTIKGFAGLAYAAKLSGVPVETMTGGLEKLNKTLGTTIVGKNKVAAQLFHHLGISLKDASGHVRSTADLMPQLADAFEKTRDPAMRAFMATTLFGKAGQELLPVLMNGGDAMKEFAKEGARLAFIATPEQRKSMREYADSIIGLDTAVSGFKNEVGAELAPALRPIIDMVKEWVVANRHWIATGIADKVKQLGAWLKQLNVEEIVRSTTEWFHAAVGLVEKLGGMKTVIGALVLALGSPLLGGVTSAIAIFGSLGKALISLGAIMWANPILLAVGLVAGAAFLLYENWDWVKEKIGAIFSWFSGQNAWVKALLSIIAPFIAVPMLIYEHWEPIRAFFVNLWAGVQSAFQTAWDFIRPIIDSLKSFGTWVANTPFGKALGAAGSAVASAASTMVPPPGAGPRSAMPDFAFAGGMPYLGDDEASPRTTAAPPPLYRDGGPAATAAQAAPQTGAVTVKFDYSGLPPGTTATTTSSGIAQVANTNVGSVSPMPTRN